MLTDDERSLVGRLSSDLGRFRAGNATKNNYYEGGSLPGYGGLTIPVELFRLAPHTGWAGVVVDALEERLDFFGWNDPVGLGLEDVFVDNRLDVESSPAHVDALVCGVCFVAVGRGEAGEPDVLVSVESPMRATGEWDARARRLSSALVVDGPEAGQDPTGCLYLPDQNIVLERVRGRWTDVDRCVHKTGRVHVARLANRRRASNAAGQSEISMPIRDLCDEASRVWLSMAVNREFFSSPQRLVLGASPETVDRWKALTTGIWTIEPDENGDLPEVTQFDAVKPGAHIDQLEVLASQVAAVGGLPEYLLGVKPKANPASADAIRAQEVRLIKKAERRQSLFGGAWRDVAELVLLVRDGAVPEEVRKVSCRWGDPATPTRAAVADETSKFVAAGVLPARSQVTYDRIGLAPEQQAQVERDWDRAPSVASLLAETVARQTDG
jgi:hypothetical protein